MKWMLGLVAAAAVGVASPVSQRDSTLKLYTLRAESKANPILASGYLSGRNGTIGIYQASRCDALRFYAVQNAETGLSEFHTYPIGIIDHVIGLVGDVGEGFMTLEDVAAPANSAGKTNSRNQTVSWKQFSLTTDPDTKDDTFTVSFMNSAEHWVAFPSGAQPGWAVTWYDGRAIVVQDYTRVEVTAQLAPTNCSQ